MRRGAGEGRGSGGRARGGVGRGLVLGSPRELGTVGLVAGLCGAYAGVLVTASSILSTTSRPGGGGTGVGLLLSIVAMVFILVAVYVSAVVIVNAVDTVVAGRLRQIALLRLLGARPATLRASVMRGAGGVGTIGAVAGAVLGVLATDAFRVVLVRRGSLPDGPYAVTSPFVVVPVATIAVTALAAGWVGSRAVLRVTAAQAMSGAEALPRATRSASVARATVCVVLMVVGALALVGAAWMGEEGSAFGLLLAFVGSAVSGTGLLVGSRLVVPGLVALVGRLLGSDPPSRVARRNAVADPLRTTRSTMGLVIGVTLVTTIASGMRALQVSVDSWTGLTPGQRAESHAILSAMTSILVAIVVVSCVISAVGFVSTMSLTVIQRQREIGLLRALGFTGAQVRSMVTKESAALAGTAVAFGLALGLTYGSVGAQSLVGSQSRGFVWGLPWVVIASIAVAGLVLVLVAAAPPARRAVALAPVEALRVDR